MLPMTVILHLVGHSTWHSRGYWPTSGQVAVAGGGSDATSSQQEDKVEWRSGVPFQKFVPEGPEEASGKWTAGFYFV